MTDKRHTLGAYGEERAVVYLQDKGFRIRDRNWSTARGELDIIAEWTTGVWPFQSRRLVFVEVKTLRQTGTLSAYPERQITPDKQQRLIRTAQRYLVHHDIPLHSDWQIDVIAVMVHPDTDAVLDIRHTERAVADITD